MKRIVKSIENLSFGSRLGALIDEKCGSNTNCAKQFASWIAANQLEYAPISHNTFSRYRTGKIETPHDATIQALAEFFDVTPEYLKCTDLERKPHTKTGDTVSLDRLKGNLPAAEQLEVNRRFLPEFFREFCQHCGYVFQDYQLNESEECIGEYKEAKNGMLFTYALYDTVGHGDFQSAVVLPSGETIEYTSEQFEQILNNVQNFIAFEFYKLKGGKS